MVRDAPQSNGSGGRRLSPAERADRLRLAELLHGNLQQLLVACRMQVDRVIDSPTPGQLREAGQEARQLLDQSIEEARSLARQLREDSSDGANTAPPSSPDTSAPSGQPTPAATRQAHKPDGKPGRERVRVLIVDDHKIVREGIANIVHGDPRFEVVGQAADGVEAIQAVEDTTPDVVIMDVNMPRMNGIEATRQIKEHHPDLAVVGLSVQHDPATVRSLKKAGVRDFVTKSGDPEELLRVLSGSVHSPAGR